MRSRFSAIVLAAGLLAVALVGFGSHGAASSNLNASPTARATPSPIVAELLASDVVSAVVGGTPMPATDHRLYRVTLQPGAALHAVPGALSTLVSVTSGSVELVAPNVKVGIEVGSGAPVRDAAAVVCGTGACPGIPADGAVLGPGNGASFQSKGVSIQAIAGEPAVLLVAIVGTPGSVAPLCWICPTSS